MKKLLLIICVLIGLSSFAQNNFKYPVTIQGKQITGTKIDNWNDTYTKSLDTIPISSIVPMLADSSKVWTTRYDLKTEPTKPNFIKTMNRLGAGIKLWPIAPVGGAYVGSSNQMVDQRASYILAEVTDTVSVSTLYYEMHSAGSYTTDAGEFNGMAIYSIFGTTATRVAITANTPGAWSVSASARASIALTAPVTLYPGIYYVGFLYNFLVQTTAPYIIGIQPGRLYTSEELNTDLRLGIFHSSVTAFPTTFTISPAQTLGILHNFIGQ